MSRRRPGAVAGLGCVLLAGLALSGCDRRVELSDRTPLRVTLAARPAGQPGLSAVDVDLDITNAAGGSVALGLRRVALGSTRNAYSWDWKGAAASSNTSLIDLTKAIRQEGVIRGWDVEVATLTKLRLKVWRDWGSEWRLVSQTPLVVAVPGLNHFDLGSGLPVERGDYAGLYVESGLLKLASRFPAPADLVDQSALNLGWAAARGLQYNIAGDATCGSKTQAALAPNPGYSLRILLDRAAVPRDGGAGAQPGQTWPISVIDVEKTVQTSSTLRAWEVSADAPAAVRLKVWRPEGASWRVAAQSPLERLRPGLNRFSLQPPLEARAGDWLGFFTDYPQAGPFPVQVDACATGPPGKLYVRDDLAGGTTEAAMFRDGVGRYAFRALTDDAPVEDGAAVFPVQSGRRWYRVPLATEDFAVGEEVELTLTPKPGTQVVAHAAALLAAPVWLTPLYSSRGAIPERSGRRWFLFDALSVGLTGAALWSLVRRRQAGRQLAWAAAAVLVAASVWVTRAGVTDVAIVAPCILALLLLPGYLLLELATPGWAANLDWLERAPLLFGLSVACWTVVAPAAYRAGWRTDAIIGAVLAAEMGALALLYWRGIATSRAEAAGPGASHRWYLWALLSAIVAVTAAVAWRAQFQGAGSDTVAHLAGYRKVAENPRVIGGNPLLGPGYAYVSHYASNPWYLAFGLTARMAGGPESVVVLYVWLSAMLTGLSFLAFYSLLKTFTAESGAAMLGTVIAIGPWLLENARDWKVFHSYFYEFMAYQSTFTQLVVFPLLTMGVLRFVRDADRSAALVAAMLAVATMGMHAQYLLWVPLVIGAALMAVAIAPSGRGLRLQATALAAFIGCAGLALSYLTVSFPLADKPAAWNLEREIALWASNAGARGLWRPTARLVAQNPMGLLDHKAEAIGLLILILLAGRRASGSAAAWRWPGGSMDPPARRLAIAAATILAVPLLITFNPLLATPIFRLVRSGVPIYRLPDANVVLAHVAVYGALATAWCVVGRARNLSASRWFQAAPIGLLSLLASLVLLSPAGRQDILGPLANHAWYASLFDLPHDRLYRGLSQLEPGVVAVSTDQAELVAALTPHYVVLVRPFRLGDSTITDQRTADNDAILNFSLPSDKMKEVLQRVHCRYVVVARGSAAIPAFRAHPQLFSEAFAAEADVVFAVKSL